MLHLVPILLGIGLSQAHAHTTSGRITTALHNSSAYGSAALGNVANRVHCWYAVPTAMASTKSKSLAATSSPARTSPIPVRFDATFGALANLTVDDHGNAFSKNATLSLTNAKTTASLLPISTQSFFDDGSRPCFGLQCNATGFWSANASSNLNGTGGFSVSRSLPIPTAALLTGAGVGASHSGISLFVLLQLAASFLLQFMG